jgi:hypothetical protein
MRAEVLALVRRTTDLQKINLPAHTRITLALIFLAY